MEKMDHLMAEKTNKNNKDRQMGQVTPKKKYLKKEVVQEKTSDRKEG